MDNSILTSIKKLLGIAKSDKSFDPDIIMHINTVFMILNQVGIGPEEGFRIEDESTQWSDYVDDDADLEAVKTYVYLKVKSIFDPPLSSAVKESHDRLLHELEWRLNVNVEY